MSFDDLLQSHANSRPAIQQQDILRRWHNELAQLIRPEVREAIGFEPLVGNGITFCMSGKFKEVSIQIARTSGFYTVTTTPAIPCERASRLTADEVEGIVLDICAEVALRDMCRGCKYRVQHPIKVPNQKALFCTVHPLEAKLGCRDYEPDKAEEGVLVKSIREAANTIWARPLVAPQNTPLVVATVFPSEQNRGESQAFISMMENFGRLERMLIEDMVLRRGRMMDPVPENDRSSSQ